MPSSVLPPLPYGVPVIIERCRVRGSGLPLQAAHHNTDDAVRQNQSHTGTVVASRSSSHADCGTIHRARYLGRAREASVGAAKLAAPWLCVTRSALAPQWVMENAMKVQVYTHPG